VLMDREVSHGLLEILPPALVKKLLLTDLRRDLALTRDYVENFCQRTNVIAGMSYTDYVRRELPRRALRRGHALGSTNGAASGLDDPALLAHGLRFARFFYERDHELRYPDVTAVASLDEPTTDAILDLIRYTLALRERDALEAGVSEAIRGRMLQNPGGKASYQALRRVFRQPEGPSAAGLLASAPLEYLRLLESIFALHRTERPGRPESPVPHERGMS
jgi:hypothetical protein